MSACFGIAVVELRVPPDQFWRMSPAGFMAALRERTRRMKDDRMAADERAGLLAALIFNANKGSAVAARMPEDFFPSLREAATQPQDPEQMLVAFRAFAAAHNARIAEA